MGGGGAPRTAASFYSAKLSETVVSGVTASQDVLIVFLESEFGVENDP